MNKKLALFLAIGTIPCLNARLVQTALPSVQEQQNYFATATPHIFFDFHNVLVIKSKQSITQAAQKALNPFSGGNPLKKTKALIQATKAPFSPKLWGKALFGKKSAGKVKESQINKLGQAGLQDLQDVVIELSNDIFEINPQMLRLIHALVENGCQVHLFSNIGATTLQDAKERNLFPELFGGDTPLFAENVINQESAQDYPLSKPQPEAYNQALNYTGCLPEQAIMVDDTLANAQPNGWTGILYSKDTHEQTVQTFKNLGLLPVTF